MLNWVEIMNVKLNAGFNLPTHWTRFPILLMQPGFHAHLMRMSIRIKQKKFAKNIPHKIHDHFIKKINTFVVSNKKDITHQCVIYPRVNSHRHSTHSFSSSKELLSLLFERFSRYLKRARAVFILASKSAFPVTQAWTASATVGSSNTTSATESEISCNCQ
jgi:hypothetical protein